MRGESRGERVRILRRATRNGTVQVVPIVVVVVPVRGAVVPAIVPVRAQTRRLVLHGFAKRALDGGRSRRLDRRRRRERRGDAHGRRRRVSVVASRLLRARTRDGFVRRFRLVARVVEPPRTSASRRRVSKRRLLRRRALHHDVTSRDAHLAVGRHERRGVVVVFEAGAGRALERPRGDKLGRLPRGVQLRATLAESSRFRHHERLGRLCRLGGFRRRHRRDGRLSSRRLGGGDGGRRRARRLDDDFRTTRRRRRRATRIANLALRLATRVRLGERLAQRTSVFPLRRGLPHVRVAPRVFAVLEIRALRVPHGEVERLHHRVPRSLGPRLRLGRFRRRGRLGRRPVLFRVSLGVHLTPERHLRLSLAETFGGESLRLRRLLDALRLRRAKLLRRRARRRRARGTLDSTIDERRRAVGAAERRGRLGRTCLVGIGRRRAFARRRGFRSPRRFVGVFLLRGASPPTTTRGFLPRRGGLPRASGRGFRAIRRAVFSSRRLLFRLGGDETLGGDAGVGGRFLRRRRRGIFPRERHLRSLRLNPRATRNDSRRHLRAHRHAKRVDGLVRVRRVERADAERRRLANVLEKIVAVAVPTRRRARGANPRRLGGGFARDRVDLGSNPTAREFCDFSKRVVVEGAADEVFHLVSRVSRARRVFVGSRIRHRRQRSTRRGTRPLDRVHRVQRLPDRWLERRPRR